MTRNPRWKLSKIDLVQYALWGVRTELGANEGNPFWKEEDFEELEKAERELMRRLKIFTAQEAKSGQQRKTSN